MRYYPANKTMPMKLLLIAPDSFEFAYTVDKISPTSKSNNEVLNVLIEIEEIEALIIPAEQTISDCNNGNFSGIELIKHIRLTPELKNINKLPIVLLHWHSIDYYITKDQENIFLYSPGIYRYRLPHCKIDFDILKQLALDESLKPYLFGSENDILFENLSVKPIINLTVSIFILSFMGSEKSV